MTTNINITWEKCIHGIEKRTAFGCPDCQKDPNRFTNFVYDMSTAIEAPKQIPIRRGCNAQGGCFCTGRCMEVTGYRDPLYPGEK